MEVKGEWEVFFVGRDIKRLPLILQRLTYFLKTDYFHILCQWIMVFYRSD